MLDNFLHFLEDVIDGLKRLRRKIGDGIKAFLEAILELLEAVYQWIAKSVKAITEYLGKLFSALFNLSAVLLELSLFYIPSLILLLIYLFINKSVWWIAGSALWFILITIIGLFYKR